MTQHDGRNHEPGDDHGSVPEPPGADIEPVTMEDDDDPDAIAHRGETATTGDDTVAPDGVGPEVRPPS